MELHHSKHHAAYVTNLNKALEQYAEAESKQDLQKMISLQSAINFNGGGGVTACWSASMQPDAALGTICGRNTALIPSSHHSCRYNCT
jgi:superoxide dismutase